jgi:arsenite methyltransferase
MTQDPFTDQLIKACCTDLYQSNLVRSFLGDSLHPGGLELTQRLGQAINLGEFDRVLDIASGTGASAFHLSQTFRCQVVGVDMSDAQISEARRAAFKRKLFDKVAFRVDDAENLKERDGDYDAVICECALSSFPDKRSSASEMRRVLRPGGRLGITDVTVNGPLPSELSGVAASAACIGLALPVDGYRQLLEGAGFQGIKVTEHSSALLDLIKKLQTKVLMARLAAASGSFNVDFQVNPADLLQVQKLLSVAQQEVEAGHIGYIMLIATA